MVQQAVQDVRGVPHCSVDDLGMEWRKLVGNMGVKLYARLLAILEIHLAGRLAATTRTEILPIR